jgi:very-short-patch-repair endonuclease
VLEEQSGIVVGQVVSPVKQQRARELRRQMTPAEQVLWTCIRANKLDGLHFRRQQVIDGLIPDFYCHQARLILEVDGYIHQETVDYDTERDRVLTTRGLTILRLLNQDVLSNLNATLDHIREAASRLRRVTSPNTTGVNAQV